MIRFIDLGNQICPYDTDCDSFMFAWWDTITDTFIEFFGSQIWGTWEEFEIDHGLEEDVPESWPLERFKKLLPKNWPNMKRWEEEE